MDVQILQFLDDIRVFELLWLFSKLFEQIQFVYIALGVVQLQLIGETLRLLCVDDIHVVLGSHQNQPQFLAELRVMDHVQAFGSVFLVRLRKVNVKTLSWEHSFGQTHLIADQRSEMNGVVGELKQEKLETLAAWQREDEQWMLLAPLGKVIVGLSGNGGDDDILIFVIFQPDFFQFVGRFVLHQFDFHDVVELLVWQFSGGGVREGAFWFQKFRIVSGMN